MITLLTIIGGFAVLLTRMAFEELSLLSKEINKGIHKIGMSFGKEGLPERFEKPLKYSVR